MFTVEIVREMIVMVMVMMAVIFMIAVLVEVLASLVDLNVNMGNVVAGVAVPHSETQPWCCRGI